MNIDLTPPKYVSPYKFRALLNKLFKLGPPRQSPAFDACKAIIVECLLSINYIHGFTQGKDNKWDNLPQRVWLGGYVNEAKTIHQSAVRILSHIPRSNMSEARVLQADIAKACQAYINHYIALMNGKVNDERR